MKLGVNIKEEDLKVTSESNMVRRLPDTDKKYGKKLLKYLQ